MPTTRSLNTVSAWILFHSDQGPHLYDPTWRSWTGWGILSFASAALWGSRGKRGRSVSGPSGWELCPQGTGAGAAPSIKGSSAGRTGASIRLSTPEGSIWGFSRGTGRVTPASLWDPGPVSLSAFVSPSTSWRGKQRLKGSLQPGPLLVLLDSSTAHPSPAELELPHTWYLPCLCALCGGQPLPHLLPDRSHSPGTRGKEHLRSSQGQCPGWGRKVAWRLRPRATREQIHSLAPQHKRLRSAPGPAPGSRAVLAQRAWIDRPQETTWGNRLLGRGEAPVAMPLAPKAKVSQAYCRWLQ